jgi:hypothetical protein
MRFVKPTFLLNGLACGFALGIAIMPGRLSAADAPATGKSSSGAFVSFVEGTLTLKSKSGLIVYENVGENYKTYQNNEWGVGSRLVGTVALTGAKLKPNEKGFESSLDRVRPGTLVRVDVKAGEINFGFDHRIIGKLVSYDGGQLNLEAVDVPAGYVQKPAGKFSVTIDPGIPALESIDGGNLKYAGPAGEVLKAAKPGAIVTARTQDVDVIEVVEIGLPKNRRERYAGQARGTVRGTLVTFKDGILRIRAKPVSAAASSEYERLIARRITDDIPISESIDGAAYRPATVEALSAASEGTIITMHKVEDVILGIQVGVAK